MSRNKPIYSESELMRKKARQQRMDPMMTMLIGREEKKSDIRITKSREESTKPKVADTQIYIGNVTVEQAQEQTSGESTYKQGKREGAPFKKSAFIARDNHANEQTFMEDAIGIDGQIFSIDAAIEYAKSMPDTAKKTELLRTIKAILEGRQSRTEEEIEQIMSSMNKEKDR